MPVEFSLFLGQGRIRTIFKRAEGGSHTWQKQVAKTCSVESTLRKCFIPGRGLPGGGQLEIRIEISADHPDPDIRGVARRVKFFNLESWHTEWIQVAEKNEELAADFEREERKVTAHEFYLRAR